MTEPTGDTTDWKSDLGFLAAVVGGTYLLLAGVGYLAGVRVTEIAGTLETISFFAAAFALLALALNLHWGYTGLFNIGVAGFMAIGVYTMAILTAPPDPIQPPAGFGLPLIVGVIGGTVVAGLVGAVIALPALRVRADYFAIITLGFSEIVRLSLLSDSLRQIEIGDRTFGTGGGRGIRYESVDVIVDWLLSLPGVGTLGDGFITLVSTVSITRSVAEGLLYVLVMIVFILGFYVLLSRLANSPAGRILKAIREDEVVAQSLGKDTNRMKIKVFALGCALMGLSGILWLGSRSLTSPDSYMPIITFYIFVALIIGGAGSNTGSVVGGFLFAAYLWEGPRFLRTIAQTNLDISAPPTLYDAGVQLLALDPFPLIGYFIGALEELRWIAIGILLVALMIYRPEGIFGGRKETAAAVSLSRPHSPHDGDSNE